MVGRESPWYSRRYSLSAYFRDTPPNRENYPFINIVCVHAQCNSRQVTRSQSARTVRTSHENKTTVQILFLKYCGHFSQTFTQYTKFPAIILWQLCLCCNHGLCWAQMTLLPQN